MALTRFSEKIAIICTVSTGESAPVALIADMKSFLALLLFTGCATAAQAGVPDSGKCTLVVTGTNIARPLKRMGNTYDTPQAIHVIDRTHIDQSSARSVAQLLRGYPGIVIR